MDLNADGHRSALFANSNLLLSGSIAGMRCQAVMADLSEHLHGSHY